MTAFEYSAYAANGSLSSGTVEAGDRGEALRRLAARHLQPVSVNPVGTAGKSDTFRAIPDKTATERSDTVMDGPIRLKPGQVLSFIEELADLLHGGIQLEPALGIMERRKELSGLKAVAKRIREKLRDGQSFAAATRSTSPSFGDMFCNLVMAGELSGSLSSVLRRQAKYLQTLEELKAKVLSALIYPAFLVVSALSVAILFVVFLIPKLMELLDSTGGSLPAGAQFIISISDVFKSNWWIILTAGVSGFALVRWWSRQSANRASWDRFKLRFPLTGQLLRERFYVQFLETLSNLVSNGLPLNQALGLTRTAIPNEHLRNRLQAVIADVGDGANLSSALEQTGEFPSLLTDMIVVGEHTGELPVALARAAERYDRELSKRAEKLAALIQPAVVVMMAGMVGAMAYLMITAIFQTIAGLGA
ncbi:MAG: type II secretory pathway component PulF [Verrucomicrobiales bacterium]|jgi:type II secretory pathway component PulF